MHTSLALLAGVLSSVAVRAEPSDKRGLVYVPNDHFPQDDSIWVRDGSDLTWYYNYAPTPSDSYNDKSQADFEFVPMLFGPTEGTAFLDTINNLIDGGRQIEHVLSFNEPDGPAQYGGSNMAPEVAAQIWVDNLIPLREKGIKVGLPACTGAPGGIVWLESFLESCSNIAGKECDYDFVAIHWYGNFEGLASHLGEYAAKFPNKTQWVTEYALAHEELTPTQYFYQTSAEYMDRLTNVDRYSYFGSFRSAVSNVGPNAVMLNNDGQLTDIGSWYLGGSATGVDPQSGSQASSDSAATRIGGRAVDMVSAVGVVIVGGLLLGIA